jgi:hypothetical protein
VVTHAKQMKETQSWSFQELFCPVIHLCPYKNDQEAIELFNHPLYALTGGIYAQSQDTIDHFLPHLKAGNLYINRPNTGARVMIEPFGGFGLSGTGPKAGSAQYMSQFYRIPFRDQEIISLSDLKLDQESLSPKGFAQVLGRSSSYQEIYLDWVQVNFELLCRQDNRSIPGQKNYDDLEMKRGGVLCFSHDKIHRELFLYVLTALSLETPMSVYLIGDCPGLRALFHAWGIKIESSWKEACQSKTWALIDLELSLVPPLINEMIFAHESSLPHFLTRAEHWGSDWSERVELFRYRRSFAINTMRHGASLELEI